MATSTGPRHQYSMMHKDFSLPLNFPGANCSLLLSVKLNQTSVAARHHEEMQSRLHILVAHALQLRDCSVGEIAEEACCHQAKLDASQVTTEAGWFRHLVSIMLTTTRQRICRIWRICHLLLEPPPKGRVQSLISCVVCSHLSGLNRYGSGKAFSSRWRL